MNLMPFICKELGLKWDEEWEESQQFIIVLRRINIEDGCYILDTFGCRDGCGFYKEDILIKICTDQCDVKPI